VRIFEAKLSLIDGGKCQEALELDDLISTVVRAQANGINVKKDIGGIGNVGGSNGNGSNGNGNVSNGSGEKVDLLAAATSIDNLLQQTSSSVLGTFNPTSKSKQTQTQKQTLTSHERAVRRQIIKEFFATCTSVKNCNNCGAFSPRLRQDNYNKIFQAPLSDKYRKNNMGQNIRILSASSLVSGNVSGSGINEENGWDSEDSDMEEEEEPAGQSTLSDNDDDDDDDGDITPKKKRESTVSTKTRQSLSSTSAQSQAANKASKPDKFMHALEVEAQVKLTWNMEPLICSQVFGNAHCTMQGDMNMNGNGNGNGNGSDGGSKEGYSIFFMRAVPVPPSRFRPPMIMGTMTVEHAQNFYLNKVLEMNDRLRIAFATVQGLEMEHDIDIDGHGHGHGHGHGEESKEKEAMVPKLDKDTVQARAISTWIDLQTTVNCYIDSSKDPSAAASNTIPNGIRQLLEKKEGIFRKHMMGKRVNFACRSVISPDPYIGTNEIGIPLYFAKTLTYPTPVTALNVAEMRNLVIRGPNDYPGARWVELPNGRRIELTRMQQTKREAIAARLLSSNGIAIVGRQLRNGDMVLMNRQVSSCV
jgi:DNA-directed RNA polymerase I subunit RPA1